MSCLRTIARAGVGIVVGGVLLGPVGLAGADIINIWGDSSQSTERLGDFSGSLEYAFDNGNTGLLTVTLTNTSPSGNGGYLTGFLFNFGVDDINGSDTATLLTATHPFQNSPLQDASPYGGPYMGGAALGGHWLGGGSPTGGIAVGDTGVFTMGIESADAMALSASSFLNGPNEFNFVVRFRGFANDGSDKVPAIPAPASAGLLALGAMSLSSRRRRG